MSSQQPVYRVEFWSGSTLKHAFGYNATNYVSSLRVKPGLTSTIGSFEIVAPDIQSITGSPGTFSNINVFDDIKIWYGYNITGSVNQFAGKIETIRSEFSARNGWTRTFIGRDYEESMDRTLQSRGHYKKGSAPEDDSANNIVQFLRNRCTGSTKGNLSTDNTYILSSSTEYPSNVENEKVFNAMKTVSDFVAYDYYIDVNKLLHWFPRNSISGPESFITGSNIIDYKMDRELSHVINQVYVFGSQNGSPVTGSDWPINHDMWTETSSFASNWTTATYKNGIYTGAMVVEYVAGGGGYPPAMSGSNIIRFGANVSAGTDTYNDIMTFTIPNAPLCVSNNNILHLWHRYSTSPYYFPLEAIKFRLKADSSNYFECLVERSQDNTTNWYERKISLGPSNEMGTSITGSYDTITGSYRWSRVGVPDWYNINYFEILVQRSWNDTVYSTAYNFYLDGLYFQTEYQATGSDVASQTNFGFRPHVDRSPTYGSNQYCQNIATTLIARQKDPITQLTITITGSPGLQIGNIYSINIPYEGFNNTYLALIDLEHRFDKQGYTSICTFTNKKELGNVIPIINYPVMASQQQANIWGWLRKLLIPSPPSGVPQIP